MEFVGGGDENEEAEGSGGMVRLNLNVDLGFMTSLVYLFLEIGFLVTWVGWGGVLCNFW